MYKVTYKGMDGFSGEVDLSKDFESLELAESLYTRLESRAMQYGASLEIVDMVNGEILEQIEA